MGAKSALVFAVLISVAAWWALSLDRHSLPEPGAPPPMSPPAEGWTVEDEDGVNRLTLERKGSTFFFAKDIAGYWMIMSPEEALADQMKVHVILRALLHPKTDRVLEFSEKYRSRAEECGVRVKLESAAGKRIEAIFFDMPSHGNHYFVSFSHQGGTLHKVLGDNPPELRSELRGYRSTRIFPFSLSAVASMEYGSGNAMLRLAREGNELVSESTLLPHWKELARHWEVAAASDFVRERPVRAESLAYYEFVFLSGNRARCELLRSFGSGNEQRFLLFYAGREEGQALSDATRRMFFPPVYSLCGEK